MPQWAIFLIIGAVGGVISGFFGIGGGIVIIPALIYWVGFSQHLATGTTLAMLLPPVGIAAAYEYYRHGNVDIKAAMLLALSMIVGAWIGAYFANFLPGPYLRLGFGLFLFILSLYLIYGACKRLGWF